MDNFFIYLAHFISNAKKHLKLYKLIYHHTSYLQNIRMEHKYITEKC